MIDLQLLWLAFLVKHFVCDYALQPFPWMYRNKGTYGHMGGIVHASIHVAGTFPILLYFIDWKTSLLYALCEGVAHYHVDWAKMNLGAKFKLRPDNSEWFWQLLGLDQLLHYLCYWVIINCVTT